MEVSRTPALHALMSVQTKITSVLSFRIDQLPKKYSRDLESMLKFILTPDEDTRPSALMILHHPILKARKAGSKVKPSGVLETDFPVSKEDETNLTANNAGEDSTFTNASVQLESSGLSLNNYLSMMSEAVDEDVRSVLSLESGSAVPKATSSVLYSPIKVSRNNKKSHSASELVRTEAQLERWAKMLEEKELELTHKERRLKLWETELLELQKLQLLEAQLAELQVGTSSNLSGSPFVLIFLFDLSGPTSVTCTRGSPAQYL